MVSEVVSGRRPLDQLRPRARPTVGPGRRPGPGHVAPEFWGARGAEGLSRDVPRRPPPVVCRCWSLRRAGFNPTKVRNVSQGSGQLLERPDLPRIDSLQIHEVPRARDLGGRIPTGSRSFSSEKSYSPSRLIWRQETWRLSRPEIGTTRRNRPGPAAPRLGA